MSLVESDTPMMQQFNALKKEHPDCILFFRAGDFYEMFGRDAEEASEILEIALTTRNKGSEQPVAMAGVPYHAFENYLNRLTAAGRKVAIAEQMEEAGPGKKLVRREVVRVVTPGTTVSAQLLQADRQNYLAALAPPKGGKGWGVALADLSTGLLEVLEFGPEETPRLEAFLQRAAPRELLLPEAAEAEAHTLQALEARLAGLLAQSQPQAPQVGRLAKSWWEPQRSYRKLTAHFQTANLEGFGVEGMEQAISAAGALMGYLEATQKCALTHFTQIKPRRLDQLMWLDEATLRNLEVFENAQGEGGRHTLFGVLNKTKTPMGARLLRSWLGQPLLDRAALEERLEAVDELKGNLKEVEGLRRAFAAIRDLERMVGRISLPVVGVADVVALREALAGVQSLPPLMDWFAGPLLHGLKLAFDPMEEVHTYLAERIAPEPSLKLSEGGYIASGVVAELDNLRELSRNSLAILGELEAREKEKTAISSLKVRYNRVFGYYMEVSRVNQDKVPSHYVRKQTLVNAERYTTPELEALEEKILGAEARIRELEYQEFQSIRQVLGGYARRLQATAAQIALLDCLCGLATVARENNYVRPQLLEGERERLLELEKARHPVVEKLAFDEPFVPNNVRLDGEDCQMMLLTGPNMAGKSTTMRLVALAALMAQAGSFVPAKQARLSLVDRIFTRVGASDNLARGQSTFMLEMNEAANILNNATSRSLVILDEIGRGTSTYDGISIAWSMAETLHGLGALTLFATHYHELTGLAAELPRLKNYNIAIREEGDHLVFTRKLALGEADKSYGIQVARLAGLPSQVIKRAHEVMEQLAVDNGPAGTPPHRHLPQPPKKGADPRQLSLLDTPHPALEALQKLEPNRMTPLEALEALFKLKEKLE